RPGLDRPGPGRQRGLNGGRRRGNSAPPLTRIGATMNDLGLKDRVVLVTGAASGIGRAVAERFHAAGSRLAIADIDRAGLDATAAALGPGVASLPLDLASEAECTCAVTEAVRRFGRL